MRAVDARDARKGEESGERSLKSMDLRKVLRRRTGAGGLQVVPASRLIVFIVSVVLAAATYADSNMENV